MLKTKMKDKHTVCIAFPTVTEITPEFNFPYFTILVVLFSKHGMV